MTTHIITGIADEDMQQSPPAFLDIHEETRKHIADPRLFFASFRDSLYFLANSLLY